MRMQCKRRGKVHIAAVMTCILLACSFSGVPSIKVEAGGKTLTLKAARKLAIVNSDAVESAEDAIEAKKAKYDSAVKALRVKEQNMKQFRWSPLLNFKFPTSPDFAEASEFQFKPVALQYDIKVAEHNLQDKKYAVSEKLNNLYVEIVTLQESIAFSEKRLEAAKEGLKKNQARLKLGQANQSDIDKLEKTVETLTSKIATDKSTLSNNLQKLSNMIGMDVTSGYKFEKPFVEADIKRDQLAALIQYTEDRDEAYYEACVAETTARAELNTNSSLMKNKYGGDYNLISSYVNAALNRQAINKKAFKAQYNAFLNKIDSYWGGKKRIVFIKIPRLWFKGDMDGTRYIEDDPYALYSNVLDYNSAVKDKEAAKKELDQTVTDTYNNYISIKNSYKQCVKDVNDAKKQLEKDEYLNKMGKLTFEEYQSELESYEELQNSMLDAMKLYSTTLYSFDRLTCGGVSAFLSGTDADLQTAVVGQSYVEKEAAKGAFYTIASIIQNQEFELSINVPDDFAIELTHYELWLDNIQVGSRTPIDKKLRHLVVVKDGIDEAKIRFYDNDKFIDDVVIDPSVESGELKITTKYEIKKQEVPEIGTYEIVNNETTGLVELKFTMKDEKIKSFKVLTEDGKPLGSDKPIEISKPLKYISVLVQSISELKVEFYGDGDKLIDTGRLIETTGVVSREDNT